MKKSKKIQFLFTITAVFTAGIFFSCATQKTAPAPVPSLEQPVSSPEKDPVDEEYQRSVGSISVSKDTFTEDKNSILHIISQLDSIMKDLDFDSWVNFIEPDSLAYWQRPENLRKAQNRLPIKGLQVRSLEDYFKFVFIPSRAGRDVTEIRYIDDTTVKAVQVKENQDIIYYYFKKINGSWMLELPSIDN